MQTIGAISLEEHQAGDSMWVAVRARGAEWSWLTREDAVRLARHWIATYGTPDEPGRSETTH